MDRLLAQVHLADEVKRMEQEGTKVQQRLKRLGEVYLDGFKPRDDYLKKRSLEESIASVVVPGIDATQHAGKLLENLPALWEEASWTERRRILMTMLEAVYVDTVEEKSLVALIPKPAFRPLFEIALTRERSGAHKRRAPGRYRLGGRYSVFLVETGEGRTPRPEGTPVRCATGLSDALFLASRTSAS